MHHPTNRIGHVRLGAHLSQGGGDRLHWRVQGSTSSPTGVGSRRRVFAVLWKLECPVGLSQKKKYMRISLKEVWCNLDGPLKIKNLLSYVVILNLVGRK